MATNTPPMYEAHFGVPMSGAVLNALNYRLDAAAIAFILEHAEAKVLLTDTEFAPTIEKALATLGRRIPVIDLADPFGPGGKRLGEIEYEEFLAGGDPGATWTPPADEWEAISLNYTSGTTGNPKGVVYHHRGAYLNGDRQRAVVEPAQASRLSVDAADVPLQRLVLPVDAGGGGGDQHLPAARRDRRDLRRDRARSRDAPVRRADRDADGARRQRSAARARSTTRSTCSPPRRRRRRRCSGRWPRPAFR